MKLKKIASLMLAGVMAVSMLAGCSGNSNSNSGNTQEPTTPATGVSAKVGSLLKNDDIVTFSDNATYNSYLSAAIKDAELDAEELVNNYIGKTQWLAAGNDVYDSIHDDFEFNVVNFVKNTSFDNLKAQVDDKKDQIYMGLYLIDGGKSEDVALNLLAKAMDNVVTDTILPKTVSVEGAQSTFKYTGSVSLQKVSDGSASVWFALVVLESDVTYTED